MILEEDQRPESINHAVNSPHLIAAARIADGTYKPRADI